MDLSELWLKYGTKFPSTEFVTNFICLIVFRWYSHGAISSISTEMNCSFKGLEIWSLRKLAVELTTEFCVLCSPLFGFEAIERTVVSNSPCLFCTAQLVGSQMTVGFMLSLHDLPSHFGKHFIFRDFVLKGPQTGLHAIKIRWNVDTFGHSFRNFSTTLYTSSEALCHAEVGTCRDILDAVTYCAVKSNIGGNCIYIFMYLFMMYLTNLSVIFRQGAPVLFKYY
jgi:hypothetical protein